MLIGYARVSTLDQNPDLQTDALKAAGAERLYVERAPGGGRLPELDRALEALRSGDTLLCWRFDRLGRSVMHLLKVVETLRERGVELRSLQDGIDTSTPAGQACFTMVAALAEMESRLNSERTREGISAARRRGRRWGKPAFFEDQNNVRAARALLREGSMSRRAIARHLGIGVDALYRRFPGGDPDAPESLWKRAG